MVLSTKGKVWGKGAKAFNLLHIVSIFRHKSQTPVCRQNSEGNPIGENKNRLMSATSWPKLLTYGKMEINESCQDFVKLRVFK